MKKFSQKQAEAIMKKLGIDADLIPVKWFRFGLNAELEHKDITKDPNVIILIVLAHLKEYPDYYQRLHKLEKQAKKYWAGKDKDIYI